MVTALVTSTKLSYVEPSTGTGDRLWRVYHGSIYPDDSAPFRLRNDLYCVEWGVKLYSLTHSAPLSLAISQLFLVGATGTGDGSTNAGKETTSSV